jgi:CMP-N,N'-diacetyllegionaminic acid synthase
MRVLGVIPARGGSKGVHRKNLQLLNGKPLIAYTAEAAFGARRLTRIVLSTDDQQIAEVGQSWGLEVPFLRPAELAADDTPTLPVIQHALSRLEAAGDHFDAVCILQPTAPFRRSEFIDGCIDALADSEADSVITVLPVPDAHNPHWVYFKGSDGCLRLSTGEPVPIPRRQELPAAFHREGSVYVTRRHVLMEQNSIFGARVIGFPVDPRDSIDINSPEDLARAEMLLRGREAAPIRYNHAHWV